MIYLLFSIIASSTIYLLFKSIARTKVSAWNVIIINYLSACILGFSIGGWSPEIVEAKWFPYSLILGIIFVLIFNLMALSTRWLGAGPTVVANKMSVIIPVYFAYLLYGDDISIQKIVGLILVLLSVFLTSGTMGNFSKLPRWTFVLPWIIFFGSGGIDAVLKYLEQNYLSEEAMLQFTPLLFLSAFIFGMMVMLFSNKKMKELAEPKTIKYGVILGMVNFGSIYFLLQALQNSGLQSSVIFPVNNTGIMLLSTLGSFLLFKEKMTPLRWSGFVLAIIAIGIIYAS